jgi:predicted DNA-binding protein (MmcQ/YjbR family)
MAFEQEFGSLRAFGLSLPETQEDFPWGHSALKVRGKTFAWLDNQKEESRFGVTVKLPSSRDFALEFDFAEPAGYGLGRSGWISCSFASGDSVDVDLLKRWMLESYRAVAPRKLAARLPDTD